MAYHPRYNPIDQKKYRERKKKEFILETGFKNTHLDLVTPVKHWDKEYSGYAIDRTTGTIYRWGGDWKDKKQYGWWPMNPGINSGGYPTVGLQQDLKKELGEMALKVGVHQLVMLNVNGPPPRPADIKKKDWQVLPPYIQTMLLRLKWVVNHIDHDKTNFSPSNLEYTTPKGNADKYQAHLAKNGKVA